MIVRSLILLTLATALLAACGGNDGDDQPGVAAAPTANATATLAVAPTPTSPLATEMPSATSTVAPEPTAAPSEPSATAATGPTPTEAPEPTATPEPAPSATPELTPTPEPSVPVAVLSGAFISIDEPGSGTATILRNPDGSHTLVLDPFETVGGPNLVVYLSTTDDLSNSGVLSSDVINLGPLQATAGYQAYAIGADIDPTHYRSVIVWCADFDVGFVGALLG